jgi:hypothetical protein
LASIKNKPEVNLVEEEENLKSVGVSLFGGKLLALVGTAHS